MNFFPLRRRDAALSELKVADTVFMPLATAENDAPPQDQRQDFVAVSPANALVTELVERDVVAAVMADCVPIAETTSVLAPLSRRHLDTIDRMVAHLKDDERRLEERISDARKELADTRLARHGYERSGAYLRRGIGILDRRSGVGESVARQITEDGTDLSEALRQPEPANDVGDAADVEALTTPERRQMH